MFVTQLTVRREGYLGSPYGKADPTKPLRAVIEIQGENGKVELNLSPELSAKLVAVVAEEVAEAGRATANALTAECLDGAPMLASGE